VRIHAAARAIERLFSVTPDHVFAAAYPARVSIPIEPASIGYKYDGASKIGFAEKRHRARGSTEKTESNKNRDGHNDFVHSFFPLPDLIPRPGRCLRTGFQVPANDEFTFSPREQADSAAAASVKLSSLR